MLCEPCLWSCGWCSLWSTIRVRGVLKWTDWATLVATGEEDEKKEEEEEES